MKNWLRASPFAHILPWLFPFIIQFTVMDGGIAVEVFRHGHRLPHWRARMVRRALPEPLARWIDTYRPYRAPQPYPIVKQLWLALAPYASERVLVDDDPFATWREVTPPKEFCLVWRFNRVAGMVESAYEGIDRTLGMGWFQRGNRVWSLTGEPDADIAPYLEHRFVTPDQAEALLTTIIPRLRRHLAVRADFRYITDFTMQMVPREVGFGKTTLELVTNHPELTAITQPATGYPQLLFADGAIIHYPRTHLTPFLERLLRERTVTLAHEDVPAFIEGTLDGLEKLHLITESASTTIRQANPMVLISALQPTRTVQRTLDRGIGGYQVAGAYTYQQKPVDMDALIAAGRQYRRFVQQRDTWFAWPKHDIQGAIHAVELRRQTTTLQPAEVMGLDTKRLAAWNVQPPTIEMRGDASSVDERIIALFKQAQTHGISCGVISPARNIYAPLAKACSTLLQADPNAMILWLTPSGKKASVTRALQSDPRAAQRVTVASLVNLRDTPAYQTQAWTLLLIQDLDQLLESSPEASLIARLKRKFAFISVTKTSAYGPPIMRALHLPEHTYERFAQCMLIDLNQHAPSRSTAAAQTSPRPAPARMAPTPAPAKPTPTPVRTAQPVTPTSGIRVASPPQTASRATRASFWEQAREWTRRGETSADWVPFQCYYPTYSDMSPEQLRWYFYWRSEVRQGRYPATDLSYIFVHVYEALACIGFDTPQAAYERLVALWERYRLDFLYANQEARLDTYLISWIADFVALHPTLQIRPLDWYEHALQMATLSVDTKLFAQAWLEKSGNWLTIPLSLLYSLADSHTVTRYYQKHAQAAKIGDMYRMALAAVDASIARAGLSTSLVECYGHANKHSISRQAYQGVLTEQSYSEIQIAQVDAAFNNPAFAGALLDILKYVGSLIRSPRRTPAAYGGTINPDWRRVIDAALADQVSLPTSPSPKRMPTQSTRTSITLDPTAIAQRQRESERLREQMSQGTDAEHADLISVLAARALSAVPTSMSPAEPVTRQTQQPAAQVVPQPITVSSPPADPTPVPALRLDDALIHSLTEESEQLRERLIVEKDAPSLASMPVIVLAPPSAPPPATAPASIPQPIDNSIDGDCDDGMDSIEPAWRDIAHQWHDAHWAVLALIVAGQTAQLVNAAQHFGKPLSKIIDEMNHPVMEQLEDLLIDPDAHTLTDYFTDTATSLVRWHLARKQVPA